MFLVLDDNSQIDERLSRTYGAVRDMENNINFCNKQFRDLVDPITNNQAYVIVQQTLPEYDKLMQLATLLRSNNTIKMFHTIQADLNGNLPSNLSFFSKDELRDYFDDLVRADTVNQVIKNIKSMLSMGKKAENDKDGYHLINFIAY